MPALRRINNATLQQLKTLLADNTVPVQPIQVAYQNYTVRNEASAATEPLLFSWTHGGQTEPLFFGFYTWGTVESKKFPGTFLALGTGTDFRIVGFPLYLLPQDKEFVYLSFKLGNNEGGKNRWFGRGRTAKELRTVAQTDQLAADIRQALQNAFPDPLFKHPTLSGEWLTLARLSLADLKPQADARSRVALKTLVFEKLLHAFIIAEKLRDESLRAAGMQPELSTPDNEDDLPVPNSMKQPLNQILYGPPGTGKTYYTALCAVSLLERLTEDETKAKYDTRDKLRARYDQYQQAGRIQFVTFHQAFSYEDFIEGIKPVLTDDEPDALTEGETQANVEYKLEDGIFMRACRLATNSLRLYHEAQLPADAEADFDSLFRDLYAALSEELAEEKPREFPTKSGPTITVTSVAKDSKIYFRHTGGDKKRRPYLIKRDNLRELFNKFSNIEDVHNVVTDIVDCIGNCNASGYWALLNHLKKNTTRRTKIHNFQQSILEDDINTANLKYNEVREATKNFNYDKLTPADFAQAPRFVLIIDEINRGNVASIFGELITLLEEGKRAGRPERLTARLPYSKADFTVPPNLYLIGTMNTADRSVEALDTALRRRFSFTEMQPNAKVIREQVGTNGVIGEGEAAIDVARILEVLNSRLEQLLDHDHCLGHALLLESSDLESLRTAFARNIVPLLQEYFFGDWGKIGLVLGEKFVTALPRTTTDRYPLASFKGYDSAGLHDKPLYHLIPAQEWDAEAFRSLYPATT